MKSKHLNFFKLLISVAVVVSLVATNLVFASATVVKTDERANSLEEYNLLTDLPVYENNMDLLINKAQLTGADSVTVGDKGIKYNVRFGTDKEDALYLIAYIKYPESFKLKNVGSTIFDDVSVGSVTTNDGYTISEIVCIYSYNREFIPYGVPLDALVLNFDVDTSIVPGEFEISVTEQSVLAGNADYKFETLNGQVVQVNGKKPESIEIYGPDSTDCATQYTATVYPDYTFDKSVIWSVDDESVATISQDGMLTPLTKGTVTIRATSLADENIYAEKIVDVIAYAKINTLTTNGCIMEEFVSDVREYTVYVGDAQQTLTVSATYSLGSEK